MKQIDLPNGMTIMGTNKHETEFLYREIFEDRVYLQHGIKLPNSPVILDVGANIGMFTLFIQNEYPEARIFAFEPSPQIYQILMSNVTTNESNVECFNIGLSDEKGTLEFRYYPNYTIMSGFHTEADIDANVLMAGIKNQILLDRPELTRIPDQMLAALAAEKLSNSTTTVLPVDTISNTLSNKDIEIIDLLKIDAEKCEVQILKGISDSDWPKIQQVVLELHSESDLAESSTILKNMGFKVNVVEELKLKDSGVYNCFATRN